MEYEAGRRDSDARGAGAGTPVQEELGEQASWSPAYSTQSALGSESQVWSESWVGGTAVSSRPSGQTDSANCSERTSNVSTYGGQDAAQGVVQRLLMHPVLVVIILMHLFQRMEMRLGSMSWIVNSCRLALMFSSAQRGDFFTYHRACHSSE